MDCMRNRARGIMRVAYAEQPGEGISLSGGPRSQPRANAEPWASSCSTSEKTESSHIPGMTDEWQSGELVVLTGADARPKQVKCTMHYAPTY